VLSLSTWMSILTVLIVPLFMLALVFGVRHVQRESYYTLVSSLLDFKGVLIENIATTPILTDTGVEESLAQIISESGGVGAALFDKNRTSIGRNNYACDVVSFEWQHLAWQRDVLCQISPIKIRGGIAPNEAYENYLFGEELDTIDSVVIGYVGIAYKTNNSVLKNKETYFLILYFVAIFAFVPLVLRAFLGKSFQDILKNIKNKNYDEMERVISRDGTRVLEFLEISDAYLRQSNRAKGLTSGLLQATEEGDSRSFEMASEIHDKLCAQLHQMKREIERADGSQDIDDVREAWLRSVNDVDSVAREIIDRGSFSTTMYLGLEAGIKMTANAFDDPRISVVYRLEQEPPVHTHKHIVKIVHEALANSVKHSQASKIRVIVSTCEESNNICVAVSDDGQGFNVHEVDGRSFGLLLMQERCSSYLETQLEVSASEDGVSISFEVSSD